MKTTGPWSLDRVQEYLEGAVIPLRLSCLHASGWPVIVSLWYVYRDGALWCAMQSDARTVDRLRAEPRCSFEVAGNEPPYQGVRGLARASVHRENGRAILELLADRYLKESDSPFRRWLLERADNEVAIRLQPERISSWDFTKRMGAARG